MTTTKDLVADGNLRDRNLPRAPSIPPEVKQDLYEDEQEQLVSDVLINYPVEIDQFPLNFPDIRNAQQASQPVLDLLQKQDYSYQTFHGTELICKHSHDATIV